MNVPIASSEFNDIIPDPKNPLEIKLSVFEGPLDLLLHLIRKKELNIYEVQLSDLTSSYLGYLEIMKSINLDLAGEFLEIAAILILLKSRQLLPRPETEEEPFEEDPEELLRQRLIEYQRYKQAAFLLASQDMLGRDVFSRPAQEDKIKHPEDEDLVFEEVSLYTLMEAFHNVLARQPKVTSHTIEKEPYRIEDRISEVIGLLKQNPQWIFEGLFEPHQSKAFFIVTFISILEMVKLKILTIRQFQFCGTLHCVAHKEFDTQIQKWYSLVESNAVEFV